MHDTMTFDRAYNQLNERVAAARKSGKRKVKIDVGEAIDLLVTLSAGYEHDMAHAERRGFDRGWSDAKKARNTATYQLDEERREVADRLRNVVVSAYFGSRAMLGAICRAVYDPMFGWTAENSEYLRDRLVHLLVGDSDKDGDSRKADSVSGLGGQQVTYDSLDNMRREVVDAMTLSHAREDAAMALSEIHTDSGGFVKALAEAVGVEWVAPRVPQTLANVRDRLVYLMGYRRSDLVNCGMPHAEEVAVLDAGVITSHKGGASSWDAVSR